MKKMKKKNTEKKPKEHAHRDEEGKEKT